MEQAFLVVWSLGVGVATFLFLAVRYMRGEINKIKEAEAEIARLRRRSEALRRIREEG